MTKKRFIKLLMSHGEQPHKARAIAFIYNSYKTPYKKAYSDYLLQVGTKRSFAKLSASCAKLGEGLIKCAQSLKKLTEVLADARNTQNNHSRSNRLNSRSADS